jgi:hypothetical protein
VSVVDGATQTDDVKRNKDEDPFIMVQKSL